MNRVKFLLKLEIFMLKVIVGAIILLVGLMIVWAYHKISGKNLREIAHSINGLIEWLEQKMEFAPLSAEKIKSGDELDELLEDILIMAFT